MSDRLIALLTIIGSVTGAALTGAGAEAFKNWYQRRKNDEQVRSGQFRQLDEISLKASDRLWSRIDQLEAVVRRQAEELETVREQRRSDVERLQHDAIHRQDEYYQKHREIERRCEALEETNQDLKDERDRCNEQVENLKRSIASWERRFAEYDTRRAEGNE